MQLKEFRLFFLSAFSLMGGIESFNRAILHAMYFFEQNEKLKLSADILHDKIIHDNRYIPANHIRIYKGNKYSFILNFIKNLTNNECWIIGHLNLYLLGYIKKLINPASRIIVICHGIEVFQPLKGVKKKILEKADLILAVSKHTKSELILKQNIASSKIVVFPNTLDPFFQLPTHFIKPEYLKKRYGIKENEKVVFTLARMNSQEGYKGYGQVLSALPELIKKGYSIRYILAGKADNTEKKRILGLITKLQIEQFVTLAGFVQEEEISDHYLLADLFVMPSKGEGFGIVFLEAMACGREVIAGNKDGSTEALQFGKLGTLVDPDDQKELLKAMEQKLLAPRDPLLIQQQMLMHFSFEEFKKRTESVFLSKQVA